MHFPDKGWASSFSLDPLPTAGEQEPKLFQEDSHGLFLGSSEQINELLLSHCTGSALVPPCSYLLCVVGRSQYFGHGAS